MTTNRSPRLGIGLPVYNGANYLAQAIEALLGQTYEDFDLIISDNASTDATEEICRHFAARDQRIRYIRQEHNIGAQPNHNAVFTASRNELFKWASDDDLYARDLIERCVAALDERPDVVLAHSWTAEIDAADAVVRAVDYPLATESRDAPTRFRSLLFDDGGDDDYGVIRSEVLRRIPPYDSYHRSDRTLVAELSLYGPFHHVPSWLYFRRQHPGRLEGSARTIRQKCVAWDPRRADRLRHPTIRLIGEYVWAYVAAITRAPLSRGDRIACLEHLGAWAARRALRRTMGSGLPGRPWPSAIPTKVAASPAGAENLTRVGAIAEVVAGRERRAS
jgi:glycosyltransferase involved in cell wall biosynthesis